MTRRTLRLALVGGFALSAVGCGEFAHTNPYDPVVPVAITITGPDIVTPVTVTVTYAYVSSPVLPGVFAKWSSNRTPVLVVLGVLEDGTAVVRADSPGTAVLTVTLGIHSQSVNVTVR
jgi:hypothetical protein